MKRNPQRLMVFGALSIACIGLAVDFTIGYDAFARAGSVMTAYGILIAGRELRRSERATARHEGRVEKLEAAYMEAMASRDADVDPEAFSRIAANFAEYRNEHVEKLGKLLATEISIVCLGTLIWGFGDLVV